MNKLSRLREDLNLKPLKYKESISSVTFYSKVNIRRKLRPKTSKFSSFVDFEHDFTVDESYSGPSLPDDLSSIETPDQGENGAQFYSSASIGFLCQLTSSDYIIRTASLGSPSNFGFYEQLLGKFSFPCID